MIRKLSFLVTIETDEPSEVAGAWIEDAVGDAFACVPEDLQVEFQGEVVPTGGTAEGSGNAS